MVENGDQIEIKICKKVKNIKKNANFIMKKISKNFLVKSYLRI